MAVRVRLADGRVVELVKDCACLTHEGPHWLHMDRLWRERNQKFMVGDTMAGARAFVAEEQRRLQKKREEMEARGIVEILKVGKAEGG